MIVSFVIFSSILLPFNVIITVVYFGEKVVGLEVADASVESSFVASDGDVSFDNCLKESLCLRVSLAELVVYGHPFFLEDDVHESVDLCWFEVVEADESLS